MYGPPGILKRPIVVPDVSPVAAGPVANSSLFGFLFECRDIFGDRHARKIHAQCGLFIVRVQMFPQFSTHLGSAPEVQGHAVGGFVSDGFEKAVSRSCHVSPIFTTFQGESLYLTTMCDPGSSVPPDGRNVEACCWRSWHADVDVDRMRFGVRVDGHGIGFSSLCSSRGGADRVPGGFDGERKIAEEAVEDRIATTDG